MPKLIVHRRAARYFERMDERIKAQLKAKLEKLAQNPAAFPGIKPMQVNGRASLECAMGICA